MGTIFVDNLEPQSGTSLTLGASGDTIALTSGAIQSNFLSPAFHAYASGGGSNQTVSDATATKITLFDTELFDTDSAYDNTSGNYKFTVPSGEAGKYFVYAKLSYSASSSNRIRFFKNGSLFSDTFYDSNNNGTIDSSLIMDLSASDYIQIKAFATTSFTTYGSDYRCVFLAYKLIGV